MIFFVFAQRYSPKEDIEPFSVIWIEMGLMVGCVECYTATEGAVCVFCWKTEDLLCLNRVNTALDEWHSET